MIEVKALAPARSRALSTEDIYRRMGVGKPPSRVAAGLAVAVMAVALYLKSLSPSLATPDPALALGAKSDSNGEPDEHGRPDSPTNPDAPHPEDETGSIRAPGEEIPKALGSGGAGPALAGLTDFLGIDSPAIDYEQLPVPRFRPATFDFEQGGEKAGNDNGRYLSSGALLGSSGGSGVLFGGDSAGGHARSFEQLTRIGDDPGASPPTIDRFIPVIVLPTGSGGDPGAGGSEGPPPFAPRNRPPRLTGPVRLADIGVCQTLLITILALLAGATDADADNLTIVDLHVSGGNLTAVEGGWLFTPTPGAFGEIAFFYGVSDGTVTVTQSAALQVVEFMPLIGTPGDDTLIGTDCADVTDGREGNDTIDARGGRDIVYGGLGNDLIMAGSGNDTVYADAGDDVVYGGEGNDIIHGGAGIDHLYGEDGDDAIFGDDGDDLIVGGSGNDQLSGGAGNDTILGDDGGDVINAGAGDDVAFGGLGNDFIDGGDGNDTLSGDAGDDHLIGGSGNDRISGSDGNDIIDAGDGDDEIDGGTGDNTIFTGSGRNEVVAADGDNIVVGGSGIDIVQLGAGQDFVMLGGGDDVAATGGGADRVFGEDGNDTLFGEQGDDILSGGEDNDLLVGGAGMDRLFGDGGDDVIDAGDGDDTIEGGDGADIILAGLGNDLVDGGAGYDTLHGDDGDDRVAGGDGDDVIFGDAGNDRLAGNDGNDVIAGGDGDDVVEGGRGDDVLDGGQGRDIVDAGVGDDRIIVTLGCEADYYDGGAGFDTLDLSLTSKGVAIDLGNGKAVGIEIGRDTILAVETVIGGKGADTFIVGDRAMSLSGGKGADLFAFEVPNGFNDTMALVHKILDLEAGDRIIIQQYEIRSDSDAAAPASDHHDPFGKTYIDAPDDNRPFRFRIETVGEDESTFIDVYIDDPAHRDFSIEILGEHKFYYF